MAKGKGKKSWVTIQSPQSPTSDSDCMTILPTQTQELTVTGQHAINSDSDVVIQQSGYVMQCKKKQKRSLSRKKGSKVAEPPVVGPPMTTNEPNSAKKDNDKKDDEALVIPKPQKGGQN